MKIIYKQTLTDCLIFGLLIGITFILASYLYFYKGFDVIVNPQLSNINYFICIAGIFIGVRKIRAEIIPNISYWQAFLFGSLMIAIAAIPYTVYTYILLSNHPDIIQNTIQILEKSLKEGNYTDSQTDTFISIYKAFATPLFMAISQFLNKAFMGIIFSLFMASFLSSRKNLSMSNNSSNFDEKENNN